MNRLMQVAGAIGMLLAVRQGPARLAVPESLKAPADEEVILAAHASGVQIYVCHAAADQEPRWVSQAPDADLTDVTGKKIAHHLAGPTWTPRDGSEAHGNSGGK